MIWRGIFLRHAAETKPQTFLILLKRFRLSACFLWQAFLGLLWNICYCNPVCVWIDIGQRYRQFYFSDEAIFPYSLSRAKAKFIASRNQLLERLNKYFPKTLHTSKYFHTCCVMDVVLVQAEEHDFCTQWT